jgi:hypothetical protein
VNLTTHLHLVPRSKKGWNYTSAPPARLRIVYRDNLLGDVKLVQRFSISSYRYQFGISKSLLPSVQVHGVTYQKITDFILIFVRTSNVTISIIYKYSWNNRVGYATTKEDTTNECYNEQFLSIKSGCYNEHRCYYRPT